MKKDLSAWLAWQEQAHPKAWDLGLTRIGEVWKRLGAPRLAEKILIIAGTNGKGSCVRWAEEIAIAQGLRVGSFSSPHLRDYRERIRFQNQWVKEEDLIAAFERIDAVRGDISLTYFEWSALAAFDLMAREALQLAILEVGLGGRLDACNLIDADAAIITRIGLDHQDWLGDNIEAIAREKAGVMRPQQDVFCSDAQPPEALRRTAETLGARFHVYGQDFQTRAAGDGFYFTWQGQEALLPYPKFMHGRHQWGHFAAVATALASWFTLEEKALREALLHTQNEGRLLQRRFATQEYLLDVAHNQDSAEVLAQHLQSMQNAYPRIAIVCSILSDKDHQAILKAFQPLKISAWHFLPLEHPRGSSLVQLQESASQAGLEHTYFHNNTAEALQAARADLVVVMGSFITVSEALNHLEEK